MLDAETSSLHINLAGSNVHQHLAPVVLMDRRHDGYVPLVQLTELHAPEKKVAAESEDVVANAKRKLQEKRLDLIVANDITEPGSGFDVDTNKVTLIDRDGKIEDLPLLTKRELADKMLDRVVGMMGKKVRF